MGLQRRNAVRVLSVLEESIAERNSQLVFLLSFYKHKRNGSMCLLDKKENPSVWDVGTCESVSGSCSQVLTLRNLILMLFSVVLKIPRGWGWLSPGSPAARIWIWWPSGHSCWGDWALFPRGMCHHPTAWPVITVARDGKGTRWVRFKTQRSPFSRALLSLNVLVSLSRSSACL